MSNGFNKANGTMEEEYLAEGITRAVTTAFNDLKIKSGKPIIRSNGIKEWSVLSGLVAIIPKENNQAEFFVISVSTGVKAMPNKVRRYSKGLIVHDMHAEILSLRLFNWFLLNECLKLKDEKYRSKIITKLKDNKFSLKKGIRLGLYVSEPPCGDASMSYTSANVEDNTPWDEHPQKKFKIDENKSAIRGRAHLNKLGIVRTKPGRADSLVSLSKSCSDKLCLKQLLGLTNAFTSELFPESIFLDYIVLQKHKIATDDINRCFYERFVDKIDDISHKVKIFSIKSDKYPYHRPPGNETSSPSPLSLLYVPSTREIQVLNNGVKNGSFIKNKPPKKGGESFICNYRLYQMFKEIDAEQKSTTYERFKRSNLDRQTLKRKAQETLGSWISTDIDDFEFV